MELDNESKDTISQLLWKLVSRYNLDKNAMSVYRFSMKILASSNDLPSYCNNESALVKMIYTRMVSNINQNSNTVSMKFNQNYEELLHCKSLSEKTRMSMLALLCSLHNNGNNQKYRNVVNTMNIQSAIESNAFKNAQTPFMPNYASLSELNNLNVPQQETGNRIHYEIQEEKINISEEELIHDLISTFHDIDGKYLYYDESKSDYIISDLINISCSNYNLVQSLLDLSRLYKQLKTLFDSVSDPNSHNGVIRQAFYTSAKEEFQNYYKLLAYIEYIDQNNDIHQSSILTLRRLYLWIQQPLTRLRYLYAIFNSTKELEGGALLSAIYNFTTHGDPLFQDLAIHLLSLPSKLLFESIWSYIHDATVNTMNNEFFIMDNKNVSDPSMWEKKFILNGPNIPQFLSMEFCKTIFLCGKYFYYIRYICQDLEWNVGIIDKSILESTTFNNYQSLYQYSQSLLKLYKLHSFSLLNTKFKFLDYFNLFNSIYLYANGSFIDEYMALLSDDLYKLPTKFSTSKLSSIMDQALHNSTLKNIDNEILNCIQLKMDDPNKEFLYQSLYIQIDIPKPLYIFYTRSIQYLYRQIFSSILLYYSCLYNIKKCYELQCFFKKYEEEMINNGDINSKEMSILGTSLHIVYELYQKLLLFFNSLNNYMFYDILYNEINKLKEKINKCESIDELLTNHQEFINNIMNNLFINTNTNNISKQINKMCTICNQYYNICDQLKQRLIRSDTLKEDLIKVLENLPSQIQQIRLQYNQSMNQLLTQLSSPPPTFSNLRYLGLELNFNHYYD